VLARVKELGRTYEDGNSDLLGYTYHPIPFAGFEHVNAHRDECDARLRAILDALKVRPGDWILDVGANVGFFAFSLARLGAIVEAEPHSAF
jgi:2-polyprenyl-3-methyl-5-hydroxy-6-metoxy-1,4-benzoquinol methylase